MRIRTSNKAFARMTAILLVASVLIAFNAYFVIPNTVLAQTEDGNQSMPTSTTTITTTTLPTSTTTTMLPTSTTMGLPTSTTTSLPTSTTSTITSTTTSTASTSTTQTTSTTSTTIPTSTTTLSIMPTSTIPNETTTTTAIISINLTNETTTTTTLPPTSTSTTSTITSTTSTTATTTTLTLPPSSTTTTQSTTTTVSTTLPPTSTTIPTSTTTSITTTTLPNTSTTITTTSTLPNITNETTSTTTTITTTTTIPNTTTTTLKKDKDKTIQLMKKGLKDEFGNGLDTFIYLTDTETKESKFMKAGEKENITEGIYDIEVSIPGYHIKALKFKNVRIDESFEDLFRMTDVSLDTSKPREVKEWTKVFAIDPSTMEFESGEMTVQASGNALYKCKEWDYDNQACYGEWDKYMDIVPGQEYTIPLTPDDPGYGEANITIINVQSYPTVGGNWTVRFTTEGMANLTITPIDGTTWDDVFFDEQLTFIEVRCGPEVMAYDWVDGSVYIQDYECDDTGYEVSQVNLPGKHHLMFQFGDDVKFAHNDAKSRPILKLDNGTSAINTTELVGYWDFDEGTGNLTYDRSGNGNSGLLYNETGYCVGSGCPSWNTGRFGKALGFDGNGDGVNISEDSDFRDMGTGTISIWVYPMEANNIFFYYTESTSSFEDYIRLEVGDEGYQLLQEVDNGETLNLDSDSGPNYGSWEHIVVTQDGTTSKMYVNGVQQAETGGGTWFDDSITDGTIKLGDTDWEGWDFNGSLDELQIWNRSLTSDEVKLLYSSSAVYGSQSNFTFSEQNAGDSDVFYDFYRNGTVEAIWHMDEGSGTYVYDETGNNYTAIVKNNTPDGVIWQSGDDCMFGGCLNFTGVAGNYLETDTYMQNGSMTILAWIYPIEAGVEDERAIASMYDDTSAEQQWLFRIYITPPHASALNFIVERDVGGINETFSTTTISNNAWTHVAVTYDYEDEGKVRFYINGSGEDGVSANGGAYVGEMHEGSSADPIRIGAQRDNGANDEFNGTIDELRIYPRVLSDEEILCIFGNNCSLYGLWNDTTSSLPVGEHFYTVSASPGENYTGSMLRVPLNVTPKSTPTLKMENGTDFVNTSGLVGYWAFDESTGSYVRDLSGKNNTGSITGAAWNLSGKYGTALTFDTDKVQIDEPDLFDLSTLTMEAWIYPTVADSTWNTILDIDNDEFQIAYINSSIILYRTGCGAYGASRGDTISTNEWHHVAVVKTAESSNNVFIYVDGNMSNVSTCSFSALDAGSFMVGDGLGGDTEYFVGMIDEVRFWGRNLSSSEIETLYSSSAVYGSQSNFTFSEQNAGDSDVFYDFYRNGTVEAIWHMDEGSGTYVHDETGNNHTGVLMNSTDGVPTWFSNSSCKFGSCLDFDGVGDYVEIGDFPVSTTDFSIGGWIYFDTISNDERTIVAKYDTRDNSYKSFLWRVNTNGQMEFYTYDGGQSQRQTAGVVSAGNWYYVTVVYDTSENDARQYLNGVYIPNSNLNQTTNGIADTSTPVTFGSWNSSSSDPFNGRLDEMRFYNRKLTEDEIVCLYGNNCSLYGLWNETTSGLEEGEHFYTVSASPGDNYMGSLFRIPLNVIPETPVSISLPVLKIENGTSFINTSGLVGYWDMEEGMSTAMYDRSGNGNNGTLVGNGNEWTDGRFGKALWFNGTNNYVDLGTDKFDYQNITVCAWIKTSYVGGVDRRIVTTGDENTYDWTLTLNESGSVCISNTSASHNTACSDSAVIDGEWHFVCGLTNPETMFLDGVLQSGIHPDSWTFGSGARIGSRNSAWYFNGTIDEVMIFNRSLNADEIGLLYKSEAAPVEQNITFSEQNAGDSDVFYDFYRNGSVVSILRMDEEEGDYVYDETGSNGTGRFQAAPARKSGSDCVYGGCLDFDGNDDMLPLGDVTKVTGAHTIMFWINPQNWTHAEAPTVLGGYGLGNQDVKGGIALTRASTSLYYDIYNDTRRDTASTALSNIPEGEWSHIALWWDGTAGSGRMKIYVNGTVVGTGTAADVGGNSINWGSNLNFTLGKDGWDNVGRHHFNGSIDEFYVYDRALENYEIICHWANNCSLYGLWSDSTGLEEGYYYYTASSSPGDNYSSSLLRIPLNVTADLDYPRYFAYSTASNFTGQKVQFFANFSDNVGLSGYIFSWDNGTGTMWNESWVSLSGVPSERITVNKLVNASVGGNVSWMLYVNDTSDHWNSTPKSNFTAENSTYDIDTGIAHYVFDKYGFHVEYLYMNGSDFDLSRDGTENGYPDIYQGIRNTWFESPDDSDYGTSNYWRVDEATDNDAYDDFPLIINYTIDNTTVYTHIHTFMYPVTRDQNSPGQWGHNTSGEFLIEYDLWVYQKRPEMWVQTKLHGLDASSTVFKTWHERVNMNETWDTALNRSGDNPAVGTNYISAYQYVNESVSYQWQGVGMGYIGKNAYFDSGDGETNQADAGWENFNGQGPGLTIEIIDNVGTTPTLGQGEMWQVDWVFVPFYDFNDPVWGFEAYFGELNASADIVSIMEGTYQGYDTKRGVYNFSAIDDKVVFDFGLNGTDRHHPIFRLENYTSDVLVLKANGTTWAEDVDYIKTSDTDSNLTYILINKTLTESYTFMMTTSAICDVYVYNASIPYTINENNTYYCLAEDVGIYGLNGTLFQGGTDNSTFDCLGYSMAGNDTDGTYGVFMGSSDDFNNTIKNCNISDYYDGIHVDYADNISMVNNTVSSSVNDAIRIGDDSNYDLIANNILKDCSNTNGQGIYLYSNVYTRVINNTAFNNDQGIIVYNSDGNTITNNTFHTNQDYGIWLYYNSDNNYIYNNTIYGSSYGMVHTGNFANDNDFVDNQVYGVTTGFYNENGTSSNVTGGSIVGTSYDFYIRNGTHNFTDTNFTAARNIRIYGFGEFRYNNDTAGDVWLSTNVSGTDVTLTRTLSSWTSALVQWNESASTNTPVTYGIVGLDTNTIYNVFNDSVITYFFDSGASGSITFTIGHDTNEHEIIVSSDSQPPKFFNNASQLVTTYSPTGYSNFSVNWTDDSQVINGSYIEHNFTGTLKNYTMSYSAPDYYYNSSPLTVGSYQFRFVANDSSNNQNSTETLIFTIVKDSNILNIENGTSVINTTGLVGYWTFDEGVGSQVFDMSGFGNTGSFYNYGQEGSNRVVGRFGKAARFHGNDTTQVDYVFLTDKESLDFNASETFSIEAWIYIDSLPSKSGNASVIASDHDSGAGEGYRLAVSGISDKVALWNLNNWGVATYTQDALVENRWYHVVAVYGGYQKWSLVIDGDNKTMLTDGTDSGSYPWTSTSSAQDFHIGKSGNRGSNMTIDEVRVWQRALNMEEIAMLYESSILYGSQSNFTFSEQNAGDSDVFYDFYRNGTVEAIWHMDEGSGTYVYDETGNNHSLIINGATWNDSGKYGTGLYFDQPTDFLNVSNDPLFNYSTISIEGWVYPLSSGVDASGYGRLIEKHKQFFVYMYQNDEDARVWFYTNGVEKVAASGGSAVTYNDWHHLVATFNGTHVLLYVDGNKFVGDTTTSIDVNTNVTNIGNRYDSARAFDGKIDEVRIYPRALSDEEIICHYGNNCSLYGLWNDTTSSLPVGEHFYTAFASPGENYTGSMIRAPLNIISNTPSYCDVDIYNSSIPYTVYQNNTYYCLAEDVGYAGSNITFIEAGTQNITINCMGNSIDGDDSSGAHGVYINGTDNSNITITNCNFNDLDYGVYSFNVQNLTLNNNTVSSGTMGAFYLLQTHNSSIVNNTGFSNSYYGLFLSSSDMNMVEDNTYGILYDTALVIINSDYNNIINNTFRNSLLGVNIYGDSKGNRITGGSVHGNMYDYNFVTYGYDGIDNIYRYTNHTNYRSWRFQSDDIVASYSNDTSDGILLNTTVEENGVNVTRLLLNWTSSSLEWNDSIRSSHGSLLIKYNISGISADTYYIVTNNSAYLDTILTDSEGSIKDFSLNVSNDTEMNFKFEELTDVCVNLTLENAVYYLTGNVSAPGQCFGILANNVTIDCQNHWVNYSQVSVGYGVNSTGYNQTNIRNCNFFKTSQSGYRYAIYYDGNYFGNISNNSISVEGTDWQRSVFFDGSSNNTFEYNLITGLGGSGGANNEFVTFQSSSNFNNVSNNTINGGMNGAHSFQFIGSNYNRISSNVLSSSGGFWSYGVSLSNANDTVIVDNNISGKFGLSYGISVINSTSATISNNLMNMAYGSALFVGGGDVSDFYDHTIGESNLAHDKAIKYYGNQQDLTIENNDTWGELMVGGSDNVTIKNITISRSDGIVLSHVTNSTIIDSNISEPSSAGMYISYASRNNTIVNNTIYVNTSCVYNCHGLYIYLSHDNIIDNNDFEVAKSGCGGNACYGIYQQDSSSINITNNNVTSGIYNSYTYLNSGGNDSYIIGNYFLYSTACSQSSVVRFDDSHDNVFQSNFVNNTDSDSAASMGIEFYESSNNTISDSTINISSPSAYTIYVNGDDSLTNYLVNCTFNQSDVGFADTTESDNIEVKWYLDVYVNNSIGDPIHDANVTGWFSNTSQSFSVLTDNTANIARRSLTEYIHTPSQVYPDNVSYVTNYTINATKSGFTEETVEVNLTQNRYITLELTDEIAPKYSNNYTNNTAVGLLTSFDLYWTDNHDLHGYIFSTNNTGTWINDTWVDFDNATGDALLIDRFEDGTFDAWTSNITSGNGTAYANSTDPYTGSYHANFTVNYTNTEFAALTYALPAEQTEVYARAYMKFDKLPDAATDWYYEFRGDNDIFDFRIRSDGAGGNQWQLQYWDQAFQQQNSAETPEVDRWYCIEMYGKVGNETGEAKLFVDGELVAEVYDINSTGRGNISSVRMGIRGAEGPHTVLMDDVVISTSYIGCNNASWSNTTKTLNSTQGTYLEWKVYANDTTGNWNGSETFSLTTEAGQESISGCSVLDEANRRYLLTESISDSGDIVCMNITAANVTLDCQGNMIDGQWVDDTYGVLSSERNTTVANCEFNDWGTSIYYNASNSSRIENVTSDGHILGSAIILQKSHDNALRNVTITTAWYDGISVLSSNDTNITNATIQVEWSGIYLEGSYNSFIEDCVLDAERSATWSSALYIYASEDVWCNHVVNNVSDQYGNPILLYNDTVTIRDWYDNASLILLCNADDSVLDNITMDGDFGIRARRTQNANFTNIEIDDSGSIFLTYSGNARLENITTRNGHGLYIHSSSGTTVKNLTSTGNSYGVNLQYFSGINVTGGSIWNNTYDYYERGGTNNNNFTDTNFTGTRSMYFEDSGWISYNNETGGDIWLSSTVDETENITRKLTYWNVSVIQWNDTSTDSVTMRYNISGLSADSYYKVYNNSQLVQNLKTDDIGSLPSFTIDHDNTERQITVQMASNLTDCAVLDINDSVYYLSNDIGNSAYAVCMNITASNVTLDCQGNTIDGTSTSNTYGVLTNAYDTALKNCVVNQWSYGVFYNYSNNSRLDNVSVNTNSRGISIEYSDNVTLDDINITQGSTDVGMRLIYSNNDTVSDVFVNGADTGIRLDSSHNATFTNTNVSSHIVGFYISVSENGQYEDSTFSGGSGSDVIVAPSSTGQYCDHAFLNVNGSYAKPFAYYNDTVTIRDWNNNVSQIILCDADDSVIENVSLSNPNGRNRLYVWSSDNVNISNLTISGFDTGLYMRYGDDNIIRDSVFESCDNGGVFIESSDGNIIENVTSRSNDEGIWILYSLRNNVSLSSFYDNSFADYYLGTDAGSTHNFTETNFTEPRRVYFNSDTDWFNYNNESSGDIWLKTNFNERENITRELAYWNVSVIQWNDTSNDSVTATYNLTGLSKDSYYKVYNGSQFIQSIKTDSKGDLPSFTIDHDNTERQITVQMASNLTDCAVLDIENSVYYLSNNIDDSAYTTCMNVTAANVTLDCQGFFIEGTDAAGSNGFYSNRSNTTVIDCHFKDWEDSIDLDYSNYTLVRNVTTRSHSGITSYSIPIYGSYFVNLTNVTVYPGDWYPTYDYGIHVSASKSVTLLNVTVNTSGYGVFSQNSENTIVRDSVLTGTSTQPLNIIPAFWISTRQCDMEVVNVKGKDGLPIVFYNDTVAISGWYNNVSEILLCNADGSTFDNITMEGQYGIVAWELDDAVFSNIEISNTPLTGSNAMFFRFCDDNQLTNITLMDNSYNGLNIWESGGHRVENLTATGNYQGLVLQFSGYDTNVTSSDIYGNTIDISIGGGLNWLTNNFTLINFTEPRTIRTTGEAYESFFKMRNESTNELWVSTNFSEATTISRMLVNWNQSLIIINDTNATEPDITAMYNVSGLIASEDYKVYNGTQLTYTLETDEDGNLPVFRVLLDHETQIKIVRSFDYTGNASESLGLDTDTSQIGGFGRIESLGLTSDFVLTRFRDVTRNLSQIMEMLIQNLGLSSLFRGISQAISSNLLVSDLFAFIKSSILSLDLSSFNTLGSLYGKLSSLDIGLTDSMSRTSSLFRTLGEQIDISETITRVVALFRILNESIRVSQGDIARIRDVYRALTQIVQTNLYADRLASLVRVVTQSLDFSEAQSYFYNLFRTISQQLTIGDAAVQGTFFEKVAYQGLQVWQGVERRLGLFRNLSEQIDVSSMVDVLQQMLRDVAQSIDTGSSSILGNMVFRYVVQQISHSMSDLLGLIGQRSTSLSVSLETIVSRSADIFTLVSQYISLTSAVSRAASLLKAVSQSLDVSTIVQMYRGFAKSVAQNMMISSTASRFYESARTVSEAIRLGVIASRSLDVFRSVYQAMDVGSSLILWNYYQVLVSQTLRFSEALAASLDAFRASSQSLSMDDFAEVFTSFLRDVAQSFSIQENLATFVDRVRYALEQIASSINLISNVSAFRAIPQSIRMNDLVVRLSSISRLINQSMDLTSAVLSSSIGIAERVVSVALGVTDSLYTLAGIYRGVSQGLDIDALSLALREVARTAMQQLMIGDSIRRLSYLTRVLIETFHMATLIESITSYMRSIPQSIDIQTASYPFALVSRMVSVAVTMSQQSIRTISVLRGVVQSLPMIDIIESIRSSLFFRITSVFFDLMDTVTRQREVPRIVGQVVDVQDIAGRLAEFFRVITQTLSLVMQFLIPCDVYKSSNSCTAAGCYWYGNVCNEVPEPTTPPTTTPGSSGSGPGGIGPIITPTTAPIAKEHIRFKDKPVVLETIINREVSFTVEFKNVDDVSYEGLSLEIEGVPENWLSYSKNVDVLEAGESSSRIVSLIPDTAANHKDYDVTYSIANEDVTESGSFVLRVKSSEDSEKPIVLRSVSVQPDSPKTEVGLTLLSTSKTFKKVIIVEEIMKELAETTDLIEFQEAPTEIVREDPIVSWTVEHLGPEKGYEFKYNVEEVLEDYDKYVYWKLRQLNVVSDESLQYFNLKEFNIDVFVPGKEALVNFTVENKDTEPHDFTASIEIPEGWGLSPSEIDTVIPGGESSFYEFIISVPENEEEHVYILQVSFGWDESMILMEYAATVEDLMRMPSHLMLALLLLGLMVLSTIAYLLLVDKRPDKEDEGGKDDKSADHDEKVEELGRLEKVKKRFEMRLLSMPDLEHKKFQVQFKKIEKVVKKEKGIVGEFKNVTEKMKEIDDLDKKGNKKEGKGKN